MTFSLRAASVLSKQPSYKSSDRLELDPAQVLVGPALEQVDGFCHYDLRNRQENRSHRKRFTLSQHRPSRAAVIRELLPRHCWWCHRF